MGGWLNEAHALDDLRRFVNDGPLDKPVKSKQVVGAIDGTNRRYWTWEDRIIGSTLDVTINDADVPHEEITVEDATSGRFSLATAPPPRSTLRARYYYQYFLNSDLAEGLRLAAGEIAESDEIGDVLPGLKLSALNFAGYFCFTRLAVRWAERMSNKLLLEETPLNEQINQQSNSFRELARDMLNAGRQLRADFYQNHSRRLSGQFRVFRPVFPPLGPRR